MALPGGVDTVVVTGTFLDPAGVPQRGSVSLTPSVFLTDTTDSVVIAPVARTWELSGGTFTSGELASTDSAALSPAGWWYTIAISVQNSPPYAFDAFIPASGTPVDISTLAPLESVPAMAAFLPLAGGQMTGPLYASESPVLPAEVATKAYVDATATGLAAKQPVQEATTAALPANTYLSGVLTANFTGALTVDGVAVAQGDRVLVKNEAVPADNGIYTATDPGSSLAPYILTRSADMTTAAQFPGAYAYAEQGTVNGGSGWIVASEGPFTVGATPVTWTQMTGLGEVTAGTGLTAAGNTLSLATPVTIGHGGTGSSTQNFTGLLTKTAVKTSGYTAAPGDYVACDTTSGAFTVTLPTAPAANTVIGAKLIASAVPASAVTVACGSGDAFNKTSGATTYTLSLLNQGATFQYNSGIWLIQNDDLPLGQLDARYAQYVNVVAYGADPTGANDSTSAINAALTVVSAANKGATVFFPAGSYKLSGTLSANSSSGVTLLGVGGTTAGAGAGSALRFSQSGSSPLISANSSIGFRMIGLQVITTSGSFSGNMLDLRNISSTDTALFEIRGCLFAASVPTAATACIALDKANSGTIASCNFEAATWGITGRASGASYSSNNTVQGCQFVDLGTAGIRNPAQAWTIIGNTFENLTAGGAGGIFCDSAVGTFGTLISGNWFGDATVNSGGPISITGSGWQVTGNYIGMASGMTGVAVGANSVGFRVTGNQFDAGSGTCTGVSLGSGCISYDLSKNGSSGTVSIPSPQVDTLQLGTATLTGSPPIKLPSGTAGQVLASDSSGNITLTPLPLGATAVYYVSTAGSDSNSGQNWATAFATIQHAVSALPSGGGRVYVGSGSFTTSSQISLNGLTNVIIQGVGGRTGGAAAGTTIFYSGTAAAFLTAQSSAGCQLLDLQLIYTSTSFTGNLVDARNIGSGDTAFFRMANCLLAGSGISNATALIALDKCNTSEIVNCSLLNAAYGVTGMASSSYSNSNRIAGNQFNHLGTCAILGSGQGWVIEANTFESLAGGSAGAYTYGAGQGGNAVTFSGNWFGDVTNGGTWITWGGNNLVVRGNYMGGDASTTGVAVTSNSCFGIEITSNDFATMNKAVDLGSTTGHTNFAVMFNTNTSVTTQVNATTWPTGGILYTGSVFRIGNFALTGEASGSGHGVIIDAETAGDTAASVRGGQGLYVTNTGGFEKLRMDAGVTLQHTVTSVTTTSTLANNIPGVVLAKNAITVTLGTPTNGMRSFIKNTDSANSVTLTASSGTIDSASSLILAPLASAEITADGTNWWIVANETPLAQLDSRYGEKPATTEVTYYVSAASSASDSNDGLSWGSAKATIAGAVTAIGSTAGATNPGTIYLGKGTWALSATQVITGVQGFTIRGRGPDLTTVTGPAGAAAFQFVNCYRPQIADLAITTSTSGTGWGLEFTTNTSVSGVSSRARMSNLLLGQNGTSLAYGIRWKLFGGLAANDGNNDQGLAEDVRFVNIAQPIAVEHSNSLLHIFSNPHFYNCGGGAVFYGGSATVVGATFVDSATSGFMFDFQAATGVTNADYDHTIDVIGVHCESGLAWVRSVTGAAGANSQVLEVRFTGGELVGTGASPGYVLVDWENTFQSTLAFSNMHCLSGASGSNVNATSSSSTVTFTGCIVGVKNFTWAGTLALDRCTHIGPPAFSGGTLSRVPIEGTTVTTPTTTATLANQQSAAFASTSGGAYTITLGSAATAGQGATQTVVKTSSDASKLSVAPPGAQTIGGTTTAYGLYSQNDTLTVISDGANWQVLSYLVRDIVLTTTTTFTVPGGWSLIEASVVGGGGGGSGAGTPSSNINQTGGAGGTASAEVREFITVTPALALTCTVGAAGTGGGGGAAGGNGGTNGGQGGASNITGSGIPTVGSPGGFPGTASGASSTSATSVSPWGATQSVGVTGTAGSTGGAGTGGAALSGSIYAGGTPVGLGSGGGGGGGSASSGSSLGGTAGSPGTPQAGGAAGAAGGSGTANGATAADAATTSYGAGGGGGGAGATASGTGGSGGKGGPGVIVLRRRG